jgi:hypothetical protein
MGKPKAEILYGCGSRIMYSNKIKKESNTIKQFNINMTLNKSQYKK